MSPLPAKRLTRYNAHLAVAYTSSKIRAFKLPFLHCFKLRIKERWLSVVSFLIQRDLNKDTFVKIGY